MLAQLIPGMDVSGQGRTNYGMNMRGRFDDGDDRRRTPELIAQSDSRHWILSIRSISIILRLFPVSGTKNAW